jgi:MinD superfamily P-loop ATPase
VANRITEECVSCGACERICPTGAISEAEELFVVDPTRCSECVGFHHTQQCARVCPAECCEVDPQNVETEEALYARARGLAGVRAPLQELGPESSRFQAGRRGFGSAVRRMGRSFKEAVRGASRGR